MIKTTTKTTQTQDEVDSNTYKSFEKDLSIDCFIGVKELYFDLNNNNNNKLYLDYFKESPKHKNRLFTFLTYFGLNLQTKKYSLYIDNIKELKANEISDFFKKFDFEMFKFFNLSNSSYDENLLNFKFLLIKQKEIIKKDLIELKFTSRFYNYIKDNDSFYNIETEKKTDVIKPINKYCLVYNDENLQNFMISFLDEFIKCYIDLIEDEETTQKNIIKNVVNNYINNNIEQETKKIDSFLYEKTNKYLSYDLQEIINSFKVIHFDNFEKTKKIFNYYVNNYFDDFKRLFLSSLNGLYNEYKNKLTRDKTNLVVSSITKTNYINEYVVTFENFIFDKTPINMDLIESKNNINKVFSCSCSIIYYKDIIIQDFDDENNVFSKDVQEFGIEINDKINGEKTLKVFGGLIHYNKNFLSLQSAFLENNEINLNFILRCEKKRNIGVYYFEFISFDQEQNFLDDKNRKEYENYLFDLKKQNNIISFFNVLLNKHFSPEIINRNELKLPVLLSFGNVGDVKDDNDSTIINTLLVGESETGKSSILKEIKLEDIKNETNWIDSQNYNINNLLGLEKETNNKENRYIKKGQIAKADKKFLIFEEFFSDSNRDDDKKLTSALKNCLSSKMINVSKRGKDVKFKARTTIIGLSNHFDKLTKVGNGKDAFSRRFQFKMKVINKKKRNYLKSFISKQSKKDNNIGVIKYIIKKEKDFSYYENLEIAKYIENKIYSLKLDSLINEAGYYNILRVIQSIINIYGFDEQNKNDIFDFGFNIYYLYLRLWNEDIKKENSFEQNKDDEFLEISTQIRQILDDLLNNNEIKTIDELNKRLLELPK